MARDFNTRGQVNGRADVLRGDVVPFSLGIRLALALAIFGIALALRIEFLPQHGALRFLTFYPAVVLSALLLGSGPGLLTLACCAAAAFESLLVHLPDVGESSGQIWSLAAFVGTGVVVCYLAYQIRNRAEQLRHSEDRFRILFEASPVGQLLVDPDNLRIQDCNQAAVDLYGLGREQLCGLSLASLDAEPGAQSFEAMMPGLRDGNKVEFERRIRRADGSLRDLFVTAVLLESATGNRLQFTQVDITERNAAEQSLRAALKESEDLYQNAPCGYHSLDERGVFLRMNDTELKLLGYERDEVLGKMRFRDLLPPSSVPVFEATFPGFKQSGVVKNLEFELRRKDGTLVPVLLSATAIRSSDGHFVMSRSTVNDRTEHKRTEETERRLSRSLRLLSECRIELVRAVTEQGLLDAICRLIVETGGYRLAWIGVAEQDAAKTVRQVARWGSDESYLESHLVSWDESRAIGRGPTGTAIRTGVTQVNQDSLRNPGMNPWRDAVVDHGYRSSIALPLVGQGQTFGSLTMYAAEPDAFSVEEVGLLEEMARELTFGIQTLRTRAQHIEAEELLQASEERLQLALSATNLGIFDFDIAAGKLECDRRARELWGVGLDEPVSYATFMAGVHPDDRAATRAAIEKSLDPAGTGEYNITYRVLSRADGGARYASASGRVFFEGGRAVRSTGVVKDISAQKRLEKAEQERRNELDLISKQQVAAQTAAAIAHELNQPLVSISVYSGTALQMLLRGNANPEKLQHALRGAVEQAQRAGRTLHELIAFLHQGEASTEPIDLNELVQEANATSEENGAGQFRPVLELDPDLPPVLANRLQVQKVLLNLLSNSAEAIVASAATRGPASIKVKTTVAENMAQVTVQDSGPGLDRETAARVFDPFFTTKPHGMGLGLAISRALIEAHGGRLWADLDRNGRGATFHFTLPFVS